MRLLKLIVRIALFLAAAVALILCSLWLDHWRATTLPGPTGTFAVGRTQYVWIDPRQDDPRAPHPGIKRELLVWVWYPAAVKQGDEHKAEYLPLAWRNALSSQTGFVLSQLLTRDLARVRVHSIQDAQIASQQGPYPVVLMRAGLAALTTDYTSLAEDLASHGYVVVGFDAPYRTFVVVLPNGEQIARTPENNADLVNGPEKAILANKLVEAWSGDMHFALDQVEQLNSSDPSGRFLGRLDMQRIGAFGHSLGGAEALQFCHDDSRCKAGIDVDGAPFGTVITEGVAQPFMFLGSDHTHEAESETRPIEANIHSIFEKLPRDRRVMVEIQGASHFGFSDPLRSGPIVAAMTTLGKRLDPRRQIAISAHYISAFFDSYLKGAPATELHDAEYPEVKFMR